MELKGSPTLEGIAKTSAGKDTKCQGGWLQARKLG